MKSPAQKYHENMTKVFTSPNKDAQKNIEKHENNLKKIEELKEEEPINPEED